MIARWALVLLATLPLACAGAGAWGDEAAAPTEAEFVEGLVRVRNLLGDGRVAPAQKQFDRLLEHHRDQDHARGKRAELEDLVGRLAFAAAHPPPKPQDVVKGKLLVHSAALTTTASRMKVSYTPEQMGDFHVQSGLLIHPAVFQGPFTVVVSGASLPRESGILAFGFNADAKSGRMQSYQVVCGVYLDSLRAVRAALAKSDGDELTVIEKIYGVFHLQAGEPYKMQLKVTDDKFTYTANGESMGSAPKDRDVFGRFAVRMQGWERIEMEGKVEPSWIQGCMDAFVQERRREFFADFDVRKHVPDWMYERTPSSAATSDNDASSAEAKPLEVRLPAEVSQSARLRILTLTVQLLAGRLEAARKTLDKLVDVDPVVRMWLAARIHTDASAPQEALLEVDRTLELAPAFAPAQILRGQLLLRLGRGDEGERALASAVEAHPKDGAVAQAAAIALLVADRQPAARTVLETATRHGVHTDDLAALARALVKIQRGPEWPRVHECRSANYHVMSDIDATLCLRASKALEEALGIYEQHLKALPKAPPRAYPVYLFSGQAGFRAYMAESILFGSGGHELMAGAYSPLLKQLLIWNLPERDAMYRTIRHEGFHQYLDRVLPQSPVWFDEGLAVYYENMADGRGALEPGRLHADRLHLLEKEGIPSLAALLEGNRKAFYDRGGLSYAHAWLFVHMLRHGNPEHQVLFNDLLGRLAKEPAETAVRALFPPAIVSGLEQDLKAYLDALKARR